MRMHVYRVDKMVEYKMLPCVAMWLLHLLLHFEFMRRRNALM